jgi:hypothetical protein
MCFSNCWKSASSLILYVLTLAISAAAGAMPSALTDGDRISKAFADTRPDISTIYVRYDILIDQNQSTFNAITNQLIQADGSMGFQALPSKVACIWAREGRRESVEETSYYKDGRLFRRKHVFDGSTVRTWVPKRTPYKTNDLIIVDQDIARVSEIELFHSIERYANFCFEIGDGISLEELLRSSKATIKGDTEAPSIELHAKSKLVTHEVVLWLKQEGQLAPQKLQKVSKGRVFLEWEAMTFTNVNGLIWLPTQVEQKTYWPGRGDPIATYHFTIKELRVNEPLSNELFELPIKPGTTVLDKHTGKASVSK